MNKNHIFTIVVTASWIFTIYDALNSVSLLNTILLAFNASATGIYFGMLILELIVKKKGIIKLDGKVYDLRLKQ